MHVLFKVLSILPRPPSYLTKDDGQLEATDVYTRRMQAYLGFYAALTQTPLAAGTPHPHGIEHAWRWLSRMVNLMPKMITASLVLCFLDLAGYELLRA